MIFLLVLTFVAVLSPSKVGAQSCSGSITCCGSFSYYSIPSGCDTPVGGSCPSYDPYCTVCTGVAQGSCNSTYSDSCDYNDVYGGCTYNCPQGTVSGSCSATVSCNPDTSWTAWTACPPCGGAITRYNTCTGQTQNGACLSQDPSCNPVSCDPNLWGSWSSCSATCSGTTGIQERYNDCGTRQTQSCTGNDNCSSCTWGSWSACDNLCGTGKQYRMDNCGHTEWKDCSVYESWCDSCDPTDWSAWSTCSEACDGTQYRTNCRGETQYQSCNVGACAGTTQITETDVQCDSLGISSNTANIGDTLSFSLSPEASTKVFDYDNASFEKNNLTMWPTANHLEIAAVLDCTTNGQPCGDGTHYVQLKEDLSVGVSDPYFASDWIDIGEDPSGKEFTITFMVRSGSANNQYVDRIFLQSAPVNGDWSSGTNALAPSEPGITITTTPTWQTHTRTVTFNTPPAGYSSTLVRFVLRTPNSPNDNQSVYFDGTGIEKQNSINAVSLWYHPAEYGATANYCDGNGWTAVGDFSPQTTAPITVPAGYPNALFSAYSCSSETNGRPRYRFRLDDITAPAGFGYSQVMLGFSNANPAHLAIQAYLGTPNWDSGGTGWFGYFLDTLDPETDYFEFPGSKQIGPNNRTLSQLLSFMQSNGYGSTLSISANLRDASNRFVDSLGSLPMSFAFGACGQTLQETLPGVWTYQWNVNNIDPGTYYFSANVLDSADNACTGNPSGACGTSFASCPGCSKRITICPSQPGAVTNLSPNGAVTAASEPYTLPITWNEPTGLGTEYEYELRIYKQGAGAPESLPCYSSGNMLATQAFCATVPSDITSFGWGINAYTQALGHKLTVAIRAVNTDPSGECGDEVGPWTTSNITVYTNTTATFTIDADQTSFTSGNLCDDLLTLDNSPADLGGTQVTLNSNNFTAADYVTRTAAGSTQATFTQIPFFSTYWNNPSSQVQVTVPQLINPGSANALYLICPQNGTLAGLYPTRNNANFYYVEADLSHGPWWQSRGGLVFAETGITSNLPTDPSGNPAPDCAGVPECNNNLYLITKEIGSTATAIYSAGLPLRGAGNFAGFDGRWTDRPSATQGIVNPSAGRSHTHNGLIDQDYEYFVRDVEFTVGESASTISNITGFTTQTDTDGTRIAYRNSTMTLNTGAGNFNVGSNKYVIFVDGDLIINGTKDSRNISVSDTGFIAFIVSGRIIIDADIGYENSRTDVTATNANLQGVFIGNEIVIAGHSDSSADGGTSNNNLSDHKFIGAGTFVGWNGVSMNRDYENADDPLSKVANNTDPTEAFAFRPDFVLNTPEVLKNSLFTWEEVN